MKKYLFLGTAALAVVGLVIGSIALGLNLSANATKDPFVASGIHQLEVVQRGTHSYDISFVVPDELSGFAEQLVVEFTAIPDYKKDQAHVVPHTLVDGRVELPTTTLDPGDHYAWISAGDIRIAAVITIPDMSPRIWVAGGVATIEFDQAAASSWSSYVDAEGKNIYRSASPQFDENAKPLAENMAITETHFRIDKQDPALPYYYLVFVGHDGDSTYVSAPLFASATQGPLSVDLQTIEGAPTYVIDGFLASRKTDDVERAYTLRVGNFNPKNPASTFTVKSSGGDGSDGRFHFEVPALDLKEGYNDLAVFLNEDGSTLEWSLNADGVDLAQRIVSGGSVFGMRRAEALQLTRVDLVYESLDVSLSKSGSSANLTVSGRFTEAAAGVGYQLTVKDTTGERLDAQNGRSGRSFLYVVDLGELDQPTVWYDVEFVSPSGKSAPISTLSVDDITQWVATEDRTYAFADYDGLLKVFFDDKPFVHAKVQLATVGGVPSLVATGDLVGVANQSAYLRIRTGAGTIADVGNTSSTRGAFRFVFDLSQLPKSGVWWDVTFLNSTTGKVDDFPASAARLGETLTAGQKVFGFREFNSQLKVTYDDIPGTVNFTAVNLVDDSGSPVLRMDGTLVNLASNDAFVRIRSGGQVFDFSNLSTTPGQAQFAVALSSLAQGGVWYDILVGSRSTGSLVDVPSAGVDLSQRLTLGGHAYGLHEFNGQLKVSFDDVSVGVTVVRAEVVNVSGAPTLWVTGTISGTANDDVFLRVRSGAQIVNIANSATVAGEALFQYDMSALTQEGTWYDLLTGVTSTGVLVDLNQGVADLAQTLALAGRTYVFHEYNGDLKVSFDATPVTMSVTSAELVDVAGAATLRVSGTYSGTTGSDLFLRIRTGAQTVDVGNSSTTAGQSFFEYDLAPLTQAGTWYDLVAGVTSSGQLVDLRDSIADLSQNLQVGARIYSFHEYNHDLKVAFDVVTSSFEINSAEILNVSGVPTLHVEGATTGLANGDVFLRIRSGGETFDLANTASTAGAAEFDFDLSTLTQAGVWYDILAGVTPSGTLTDVSDSIASMVQTVDLDGRHYAFHEYNHLLKVSYDDVNTGVTVTSTDFTVIDGHPVLHITGTVSGTTPDDAFVRLESAGQSVTLPNSATAPGSALFTYDLSGITDLDSAYSISSGITSTGSLSAVSTTTADLNHTLTLGGRLHSFRDSGGNVQLYVETAPTAVDVTTVEIVEASGAPLLRVAGTVTGVGGDADVFLRIHDGATTIDVPNTSAVAGSALFEYAPSGLASGSYTLSVGETSTGGLVAIDFVAAPQAQFVGYAGRTYGFGDSAGDLQLAITDTPVTTSASQAEIVTVSGTPTLRVTGVVTGTGNGDVYLRIRTGAQTVDVANSSTVNGEVLFTYDMSGLTQAGSWYDVLIGVSSTGSLTDLTSAIADMSQTTLVNSRIYSFHEWSGALKIAFEQAPIGVVPTLAEIVDVSGVPTLRVTGTFTNTTNPDLFLRIRTSGETFDVVNSSTTAGQFEFAYDLSGLTAPGTWYDVLVGVTSTGALTNLTPAIATISPTLTIADRAYSFKIYSGQLKVNFDDVSVTVTVTSTQLLDVSGTPTLRVAGSIVGTTNNDVYLRVRSGSTVVDITNASATAGQFSADYALGGLALAGTWYDVLVGVSTKSSLKDVPASSATISQTVAKEGRTYAFHEFNGDLKVSYDEVRLASGQSLRIDFGPNDGTNGNATVSPDVNGKYWNNVSSPNVVAQNLTVAGLKTTSNVTTTTKVTMNGTNWLTNGIATGGLLAPTSANLGEFAIATATQDYFFVQSSGTASMTLSNLNPYQEYDLRFFGTRQQTDTRNSTYTAVGSNGTKTAVLQTTGAGIGAGGYNGNNNTIVSIQDVQPQTDGTLVVRLTATAPGTFGYLGIMEITGDQALTPPVQVPAEVARWVGQDADDPVATDSVLFVGSSSVRRWESLTRDFSDYNVIQRGWGGAHLSGVIDYSPWVVLPYDPSAIVMWAGTNDIRAGKSPQTVLDDFRTFVAAVHAAHPTTHVFYISITPTPGTASWDSIRQQTNSLIKAETLTDTTLHFIDIATEFEQIRATDPTLFHDLYVDDLHLSREGYARWLAIVRPALAAVVSPNKTVAANPDALQAGEKMLFDFGPNNVLDGDATGTDAAGNTWNNWTATTGGGLVNVGEHITDLVTATGRNTNDGMTITGGFLTNGKRSGGLQAPNGPTTALLGDLGVQTATEDYFFSSANNAWGGGDDDVPGGFMLTGLNPALTYEFHFFGSRASDETRITEYAVFGTDRRVATLQTSGIGIGANGTYNGNDDDVAVVSGVKPDAFGQVWVDVTLLQGSYAHLNSMEIFASN